MKKISKTEIEEMIEEFSKNIKEKTPKEVKKIKKIAMSQNIPLRKLRKKFCRKCSAPYKNPKIRIRKDKKVVICENCGYENRWRMKN